MGGMRAPGMPDANTPLPQGPGQCLPSIFKGQDPGTSQAGQGQTTQQPDSKIKCSFQKDTLTRAEARL